MATHSSILAWRIPWTEESVGYSPQGRRESDTTEQLGTAHANSTGFRRQKQSSCYGFFFLLQLEQVYFVGHILIE